MMKRLLFCSVLLFSLMLQVGCAAPVDLGKDPMVTTEACVTPLCYVCETFTCVAVFEYGGLEAMLAVNDACKYEKMSNCTQASKPFRSSKLSQRIKSNSTPLFGMISYTMRC